MPVGGAEKKQKSEVLVTGGGTRNTFLLRMLNATQEGKKSPLRFVVPDERTADFKEAALIALCALLRMQGIPNSLSSATGARRDRVNGAVFRGG